MFSDFLFIFAVQMKYLILETQKYTEWVVNTPQVPLQNIQNDRTPNRYLSTFNLAFRHVVPTKFQKKQKRFYAAKKQRKLF